MIHTLLRPRLDAALRANSGIFFSVFAHGFGRGAFLGSRDLSVVEQRHQDHPSDDVPEGGREQEKANVLRKARLAGEDAYQDLRRSGYAVRQTTDRDEK